MSGMRHTPAKPALAKGEIPRPVPKSTSASGGELNRVSPWEVGWSLKAGDFFADRLDINCAPDQEFSKKRILMNKYIVMLATLLLCSTAQARIVTLVINGGAYPGPTIKSNYVAIASNEVVTVLAVYPSGTYSGLKWGMTINGVRVDNLGNLENLKGPIAGPMDYSIWAEGSFAGLAYVTLEILPDTFPPDKTIILPEGTVGTVHLESSTNLVTWQDEWVHTFSNTNDNRFFRIRAERSLP